MLFKCFWSFITSAAKINYHHLCYGQCHCNKLSASNSVLEWRGVEINNFVELVDWGSWQINLRAEIIGTYIHSDKWQMWFFPQHNIFHGYICKENIYFMQDTKEAPLPCFLICNRKGLDETIMKVISKEDWIKHPQVMEIRHRIEIFCMTLLSFPLFLQLRLENPFFNRDGRLSPNYFIWKWDLCYCLLLYLQLFRDNHLISGANMIINGKQCWAAVDLYSLINSYLLLRGHSLVNIAE